MAHYGMLIDVRTCAGCAACVMACKYQNATPHGMYWCKVIFGEKGTYPNSVQTAIPMGCMHCTNAPCVKACPTGASHYDEFGNVQVNYDRCIGCRMCMAACPYSARTFNWAAPGENPYFEGFEPTPYEQLRAAEHPKGVVEKCVFCTDRVATGKEPACVQTCITRCRTFGDLDDQNSELNRKIRELGARPLMEELGTKPSVYYAGLD